MARDCIFCRIVREEEPADFVYKGHSVVAFRDIHPNAPLHILIIPRKHIRSINDLEEEDGTVLAEMFFRARDIAKEQGIDRSGYRLVISVERGGGQYVFHLHLHLMGGWGR
jgi:histidine triad (HIT) family protein